MTFVFVVLGILAFAALGTLGYVLFALSEIGRMGN